MTTPATVPGGSGGNNSGAAASAANGGAAAASGNTGAGGSSAGASSAAATGATSAQDWTSGFTEESRGYVQNKGWKSNVDLLDSYRNFEKLQGVPQEQIIRLPKEEDAAGWRQVKERLGAPSKPEDYQLEVPKEGGNPELAKWASEQFHKLGISKKDGQEFIKAWNENQGAQSKSSKEAFQTKVAQEVSSLKKEWGAAYDQNCQAGKRAAAELGVDGPTIGKLESVLGTAATVKLFQQIGAKFGEGSFVAGNPAGGDGPMTPAQAKAKIKMNQGDPDFVKRYVSGNSKERMEMEMLHKYAYQDDNG
jgi:hypothetical protein